MRQPYEPPEIEQLGTLREETQGFRFTAQQDSIFGVNVPFGGSPVHS